MNREVMITVLGESNTRNPGEGADKTKTLAKGLLEYKDSHMLATYEEKDPESGVTLKTVLRFGEDFLEVKRSGSIESMLTFKKDERWESAYETPYGSFLLATVTDHFERSENEEKINLHVAYDMEINNDFVSRNNTHIEIEFI